MTWIGRINRNMQYLVGIGMSTVCVASMYPQTLGLNRYRSIMAHFENEQEKPLDKATEKLAKEVTHLCKLTVEEEASLDFFTAYGNEVCHKGSVQLRTGSIIGLPATFAYTTVDEVQMEALQIQGEPVDWSSAAGQKLLHSLVLSEKAKAFAIGREINYAKTHHVWTEGGLRAGFTMFAYGTGFMLNQAFQFKRIFKRWARFSIYGVIGAIFYGMYVLIDDTYYCWRDGRVDRKTAAFGQDFAKGGEEFYTKLLQRNMAFYTLMGAVGHKEFTVFGNERSSWRRPHLQLSERKDNLSRILKEYESKEDKHTQESEDKKVNK